MQPENVHTFRTCLDVYLPELGPPFLEHRDELTLRDGRRAALVENVQQLSGGREAGGISQVGERGKESPPTHTHLDRGQPLQVTPAGDPPPLVEGGQVAIRFPGGTIPRSASSSSSSSSAAATSVRVVVGGGGWGSGIRFDGNHELAKASQA